MKNVTVEFPLGKFICVTGVSGSGKSSLINGTLQPIISQKFYRSLAEPLPYDGIEGLENIDKIVNVDQSPLGRTPILRLIRDYSEIYAIFLWSCPKLKFAVIRPADFLSMCPAVVAKYVAVMDIKPSR